MEQVADLLHGKEKFVYADSGYRGAQRRVERDGLKWHIAARPSDIAKMPEGKAKERVQKREHRKASMRAKVEHPFRVIKRAYFRECGWAARQSGHRVRHRISVIGFHEYFRILKLTRGSAIVDNSLVSSGPPPRFARFWRMRGNATMNRTPSAPRRKSLTERPPKMLMQVRAQPCAAGPGVARTWPTSWPRPKSSRPFCSRSRVQPFRFIGFARTPTCSRRWSSTACIRGGLHSAWRKNYNEVRPPQQRRPNPAGQARRAASPARRRCISSIMATGPLLRQCRRRGGPPSRASDGERRQRP